MITKRMLTAFLSAALLLPPPKAGAATGAAMADVAAATSKTAPAALASRARKAAAQVVRAGAKNTILQAIIPSCRQIMPAMEQYPFCFHDKSRHKDDTRHAPPHSPRHSC